MRDAVPAPLRVPGVVADANYKVTGHPFWLPAAQNGKTQAGLFQTDDGVVLPGRALQNCGFALPLLHPGSGILLTVERQS